MVLYWYALARAFLNFVIPAKAGIQFLSFLFSCRRTPPEFVIPAEAGIHLLFLLIFGRRRENRLTSL
jgi:hypothetical protein